MSNSDLVDRINKVLFPISLIFLIIDIIAVVLFILNIVSSNIIYFLIVIFIVQFVIVFLYHIAYKKIKSKINLYEGLAEETLPFAIEFLLNQKGRFASSMRRL
jgi:hypothetical protein